MQTLAVRQQHAQDNARLREALRLIGDIASGSPSALSLQDIARLAHEALAVPAEAQEETGSLT
ncbi:hypothetical protein [Paraburkholderia sp. BR14320]|uniref:hypothetical protein n=1 Tax=unclassified Paraburkholderia TaxID=2615204 RepID=UPI0034CE23A0